MSLGILGPECSVLKNVPLGRQKMVIFQSCFFGRKLG